MRRIGMILGGALLAGAGYGMFVFDWQNGGAAHVAALSATNSTHRTEWILPEGSGLDFSRRQTLHFEIAGEVAGGGAVLLWFGADEIPQFTVCRAGGKTRLVPPGEYPPAEWFEEDGGDGAFEFKANIFITLRGIVMVEQNDGAQRSWQAQNLSDAAWRTGIARVLLTGAGEGENTVTLTKYRLRAAQIGTTFMVN